jgi:putative membrane protein
MIKNSNHFEVKRLAPYYNALRRIVFPSLKKILLVNMAFSVLASLIIFQNLIQSSFLALSFISAALIADLFSSSIFLKNDSLMDLRRNMSSSLFSNIIWLTSLLSSFIFKANVETMFYLGFPIVLIIRFLVFLSLSSSKFINKVSAAILQPFLCFIFSFQILNLNLLKSFLTFLIATPLTFSYNFLILKNVEEKGLKKIGFSTLKFFRSFLKSWFNNENSSFEEYLDKIGVLKKIKVTTISFRGKINKKLKGVMVVSNFHPGPILEVGSSNLPYLIQKELESKLSVVAAVPHGVSGHETNLVSSKENKKIIDSVIKLLEENIYFNEASRFLRVEEGKAKSSCQVFGDSCLATLTLSPENMEDIPLTLNFKLIEFGKRYFKDIAIIDAHNSINAITELNDFEIELLFNAGVKALEKASKEHKFPFKFGKAKVKFNYGLKQGLGYGGAVIFLIEVNNQLFAYITIDGNNMKSGLREKILAKLKEIGIEDGEVMTTDTHIVNGLVSTKLGYHPVGEAFNEDEFIEKILNGVKEALKDLEDCEVAFNSAFIEVKVFGRKSMENLINSIYAFAKKVSISLIATLILIDAVLILALKFSKLLL